MQKTVARVEAETEDELEQIMNDIESLQEEMASEEEAESRRRVQAEAKPALRAVPAADEAEPSAEMEDDISADLADFRGSVDDAALEETLAALEQEEAAEGSLLDESVVEAVEETQPERPAPQPIRTAPPRAVPTQTSALSGGTMRNHPGTNGAQDGALTLSVTGAMTLKLRYEGADQEVEIALSPEALTVRLSDGSEFKVPIQGRRAA